MLFQQQKILHNIGNLSSIRCGSTRFVFLLGHLPSRADDNLHTTQQLGFIHIGVHPRAGRRHDPPIGDIYQKAVNVWPVAAHTRFYRVDGAIAIPENAIPVGPLGQDQALSRAHTIVTPAPLRCHTDVCGNSLQVFRADIRASKALTALSALGAVEQRIR
jgi:hypothetical protein